jgi:predicted metalloprotease with PDZ domain
MATAKSSAQSEANKLYKMCMGARGYELVDSSKASTTGITSTTPELVILKVHPNSPADRAGIKIGDRIIAKNGLLLKAKSTLRQCPSFKLVSKSNIPF